MGRAPCCTKVGLHRGPWTPREDTLLTKYIQSHGEGHWRSLPKRAGLLRCGKSCRLRWMNYLRPDIKRGNITSDEDDLIIRLHTLLGNRWSLIAGRLPGRTDNEIKNYWNTHLIKRLRSQGTQPSTRARSRKNERTIAKSNSKSLNADREPYKIYVPKPVRILKKDTLGPINVVGDLGSSHDGPCNFNVAANFTAGDDDDHLQNFNLDYADFELDRCVHDSNDSSLDNIYEEYLQLINANNDRDDEDQVRLDSFAESFLI